MYNQYKNKLQLSFNYIFNNSMAEINDYKYTLALIYKSIYIVSEDLINVVEELLKNFSVDNIEFDQATIIDHLDIESLETYLYLFSLIKNDINNYKNISNDTKLKILIVLNRMLMDSGFFIPPKEGEYV